MRMGGQCHPSALSPPGKRLRTHFTRSWVGPSFVWTGVENRAPTWYRSLDRPDRSKFLYQLSYPGPMKEKKGTKILKWILQKCFDYKDSICVSLRALVLLSCGHDSEIWVCEIQGYFDKVCNCRSREKSAVLFSLIIGNYV